MEGERWISKWVRVVLCGLVCASFTPPATANPGDGTWSIISTGFGPARLGHRMVYDSNTPSAFFFGGLNSTLFSDTQEFPLPGGTNWTPVPTTTPPTARVWHSAIFRAASDQMIMFGGTIGIAPYVPMNDVWDLALHNPWVWTRFFPSGQPPSPRFGHVAVFDPVRDRMIVFGGRDATNYFNDVWELPLAGPLAWNRLFPSGTPPAGRAGHSAIYDPISDRMVIFGGYDSGSALLNDTWSLSLSGTPAWSHMTPAGTPPLARYGHSAIFDPIGGRMVVFGGDSGGGGWRNDTWSLSLWNAPGWSEMFPTGLVPTACYDHAAVYDPAGNRMIVFGGSAGDAHTFALSWSGSTGIAGLTAGGEPDRLAFRSCAPNPARAGVSLSFELSAPASEVTLALYSASGERIRELRAGGLSAGLNELAWDGRDAKGAEVPSGVYFARASIAGAWGPGAAAVERVVIVR